MVARGVCVVARGHAWLPGGVHGIRQDTVNERAVGILLECILVYLCNFLEENSKTIGYKKVVTSLLCLGLMAVRKSLLVRTQTQPRNSTYN